MTPARFADILSTRRPTTYQVVGTNAANVNGAVSATVTVDLTYQDGFTDRHAFRLQKEGNTWTVCGNPY